MSQIIAGLYEIQNKIGAGGGGVVYLGRHLRLEKQVVLKADKRTLSTGTETLRREVDMLKGLSQTYIPQVYDFVQEDGVVYTVMDYIEGESLDKLLSRKQISSQSQVIKWACQLLEALNYLHSQPPHGILHGDIKPANIMLRPNGDVCLIDFNIALALGEDGAVKVGFSRGYASPEHYGASYISENRPAAVGQFSNIRTNEQIGNTEKKPLQDGSGKVSPGAEGNSGRILEQAEDSQDKSAEFSENKYEKTLASDDLEKTLLLSDDLDKTLILPENAQENVQKKASGLWDNDAVQISAEQKKIAHVAHLSNNDSAQLLGEQENIVRTDHSSRFLARSTAGSSQPSARSTASGRRGIMLDVRSDIYSLGATLYHLLSGRRPAQEALEVKPLGTDVCSPEVSAIIQKAMAPDPALRYQSAEEMLMAFLQLHINDRRVIRHKKRIVISTVMLTVLFLIGGVCSFVGLKQLEQLQKALTLAEYSADALAKGDVSGAIQQALQAIPGKKSILEAPVTAEAQKALTDALGVYDLSDGFHALDTVELPSAPFGITVSPKGTCFAVVYAYETAIFSMDDQQKIVTLPVQNSALSDVVFVDETHIIYAGSQGVAAYDLVTQKVLWTGEAATTLAVSADGTTAAAVNRDEDRAVIYRVSDGTKIAECSFHGLHMSVAANDIFADPEDDVFALNKDGSMLAVSFHNGGLTIFDLENPENDLVIYEESDYQHFEGGFYDKYFAFSAGKSGEARFGLVDTTEAVYVGGYDSKDNILIQTDENGIYVASSNLLVALNPDTLEEKELAYTDSVYITGFFVEKEYVLTATEDNCFSFYDSGAKLLSRESSNENCDFVALTEGYAVIGNRNEPFLRLLKLENHSESQILSYDARYAHDEARISQDGQTAMLFSYQDFCIYDMKGSILAQVELPDAENIYDQQFVKSEEGSWLEVIWYDGTIRCYSAENGALISEEAGEEPSKDLYEEFYVGEYRIASSLHAAPQVYRVESDKLVASLEEESYLTYVTQVGEYIITEYISAAGERYGILLDGSFQKLAYLPGLCDVVGDMLVFDYGSGDLRQSRLYSLQELVELGEAY